MKEIVASNHSIWIGKDSFSKLDLSNYSKVAVLVDENTKKNCLHLLPQLLKAVIIEIGSGEEHKNLSSCNCIWKVLTDNKFDRNAILINLGGGVIGDMGGFCASIYKRGIDFIQIPTTLLAMTDAAIGGKIGVNLKSLKNHIGLFRNPKSVIINTDFLKTLPEKELRSGFAEVVKHALISNKSLWEYLINTEFEILDWEELITTSVKQKNKIVLADPEEIGDRKKLNFGHTFGHAIESYYLEKGTPILHGEAIFMGIILETELSKIEETEKNEIKHYILNHFTLPYIPNKTKLLKFLKNDKKNKSKKINFSLLNRIGSCTIDNLLTEDEI